MSSKKINGQLLTIFGIILIVSSTVLTIWFLVRGETKTYGQFPDTEQRNVFVCSKDATYDLFESYDALSSSIMITGIFDQDALSSISLLAEMEYNSKKEVDVSEAMNHARFNKTIGDNHLSVGLLNEKYTKTDNAFSFSIQVGGDVFNENVSEYFLIPNWSSRMTAADLIKDYEGKGFLCNS